MSYASSWVFHISSSPGYQVDVAMKNRLSSILSIVHPNVGATDSLVLYTIFLNPHQLQVFQQKLSSLLYF